MRLSFKASVLGSAISLLAACAGDDKSNGASSQLYPPGTQIDLDGDGDIDGVAVDTNGDGISDGVDTNGDGLPDVALPTTPPGNRLPDGGTSFVPWDGGPGFEFDGGPLPVLGATSTPYIQDNTSKGGLDAATITALKNGNAPCGVKIVYPYADTTFPGGLLPPAIMWTGGGEAAYVQMTYQGVDTVKYEYAAKASGEFKIPTADWLEVTRRTQNTNLIVKLNVKNGGTVSSCTNTWRIARGNMVGSVYYNTYNHPDTAGVGAVMRLTLGKTASEVYLKSAGGAAPSGPCRSCHSVSSNGSTIVASEHFYFPGGNYFNVSSFNVTKAVQPAQVSPVGDAAFGGLTPDGKLILQMGNPQCTSGASVFPRAPNNFMLVPGPGAAGFLSTATGKPVAANGLNKDHYMWMPQFSPKGDKVVFNHAKPDGKGGTDRRELATMDFDAKTNTFSNLKVIASNQGPAPSVDYSPAAPSGVSALGGGVDPFGTKCGPTLSGDAALAHIPKGSCTGPCYPAWPFFTPDGNGVIYSLISEPDFTVAFPGRETPSKSELWYVDLTTGQKLALANANKALDGESTQMNYYPTVLPVQVGGYYWMFWTSTRKWGTKSTQAPAGTELYEGLFGASAKDGYKKRLWVSAIKPRLEQSGEFSSDELTDPSSPPFYLEGQSETGNVRAFAALNPCEPTGKECTSGIDCCTGFCKIEKDQPKGVCVEEVTCSGLNEKCETDEDCCKPEGENDQPNFCVGGYCGFVVL